jgi:streptogramin lyase
MWWNTLESSVTVSAAPLIGLSLYNLGTGTDTLSALVGGHWFLDQTTDQIGEVSDSGTVTKFAAPTGFSYTGLVIGGDNNLWATQSNGQIAKIAANGTATVYTASSSGDALTDPVLGNDGTSWYIGFIDANANAIGRVHANGTISETTIPTADSGPTNLIYNANAIELMFIEGNTGKLGTVAYDGSSISDTSVPGAPEMLVATTDGTLVYYDADTQQIIAGGSSFNVSGVQQLVAAVSDGSVWFTALSSSYTAEVGHLTHTGSSWSIATYTVGPANLWLSAQGLVMPPNQVVWQPNGDVWFLLDNIDGMGNAIIADIAPDGTISDYTVPTDASLQNLVIGDDGNLWATDGNTGEAMLLSLGSSVPLHVTTLSTGTVTLASFSNDLSPSTGYVATIDWGDGSAATTGTIITSTDGDYEFQVTGSHTYSTLGRYATTITITDAAGNSTIVYGSIAVT